MDLNYLSYFLLLFCNNQLPESKFAQLMFRMTGPDEHVTSPILTVKIKYWIENNKTVCESE